jgi:hypothetical protein
VDGISSYLSKFVSIIAPLSFSANTVFLVFYPLFPHLSTGDEWRRSFSASNCVYFSVPICLSEEILIPAAYNPEPQAMSCQLQL